MPGRSGGPYDVGDMVRLSVGVAVGGVATDAQSVSLAIHKPDGTTLSVTGNAIQHDGLGAYHYDQPIDLPGRWRYRYTTTGAAAAVEESDFQVRAPTF